jgi:[acyl-carrier-protein] S-malonyltransferase
MKNKTAILFPGQGSQMVGMGKDLSQNFKTARDIFAKTDEILKYNLSQIMFEGPSDELTKTQNTQVALMSVSIALVKILENEFGKNFSDLCTFSAGHSLGEYSALCASNAISFEDTIKLLQIRGNAMAKCGQKNQGAMSAILGVEIELVKEIIQEAIQNLEAGEVCQIANDNSVGQVVISGSINAINKAIEIAKIKGAKRAILLPVSGAFHSQLMVEAQIEMQQALSKIIIKKPDVSIIANVSADIVKDPNDIVDLLTKQITGSVRWRESMLKIASLGVDNIIEIGSGKVLCGLATRTVSNFKTSSIQNCEDLKTFLNQLSNV